jgi:hypothetical protein
MVSVPLQHDDSNEHPSKWAKVAAYAASEPTPTSQASPGLVAHWIHQAEVGLGGPFTNPSIIGFCRTLSIEPLPVLLALRGERSGEKVYSVEAVTYDVREALWDELVENRETACCPYPRWRMGGTTGRQVHGMFDCDDSLRCPKHAYRKADAVLAAARRDWLDFDLVYYAEVPDDPKVINRVRSTRRPARKAATTWYVERRDRGAWGSERVVVHFFSTRDLSGPWTRKPPLSWEPLVPEEAIERLAEALRLPGVLGFTPKWIDEVDGRDQRVRQGGHDEAWISLPRVMPHTRDAVMEKARDIAKAKWGIRPSTDFFPADVASVEEWAEIIGIATKWVRLQRRTKPPEEG